jgi:hypothetical protein
MEDVDVGHGIEAAVASLAGGRSASTKSELDGMDVPPGTAC